MKCVGMGGDVGEMGENGCEFGWIWVDLGEILGNVVNFRGVW